MAWAEVPRRRRGTLTEQLFDLAVETGSSKFLDWARKAKDGKLGESNVAQAWSLLKKRSSGRSGSKQTRPRDDTTAAARRVAAAEKKASDMEARLAKLEAERSAEAERAPTAADASTPAPAERRPAPEATVAAAEARAAELEASAGRLRTLGLAEAAESLEKQASEQRKVAESTPTPGKRIDMQKAWIKRAEARVAKAATRIDAAQKEWQDAQAAHNTLQQELDDGRAHLVKLRNEMDPEEIAEPAAKRAAPAPSAAMEELQQRLRQAQAEAERLRDENDKMRQAGHSLETELTAVKAEKSAAELAHIELRGLGSAELKKRLAQCFKDLQDALNRSMRQEAEVLEDTTKKLTAAMRDASNSEASCSSNFNPDS